MTRKKGIDKNNEEKLLYCHQIPAAFHDEYVLSGYRRPGMTAVECMRSMLEINNETLNFWTHMLAFLYFVTQFNSVYRRYQLTEDPCYWPLLCYFIGSSYPIFSSVAHAFNIMSKRSRHICFFLDYGSISIYSFVCAIAYFYYARPLTFITMDWYIVISAINAILCCLASCMSRLYIDSSRPYVYRTVMFALQWLYVNSMLFYRIWWCQGDDCHLRSNSYHGLQFVMAFLTVFFMTSKFPESIWPSRFDICGQSHQWFHIGIFLGHKYQMTAILFDIEERHHIIKDILPTFASTLGILFFVFACNTAIVIYYSFRVTVDKTDNDKTN